MTLHANSTFPPGRGRERPGRPSLGARRRRVCLCAEALALATLLVGCSREQAKVENAMTSFSSEGTQASLFSVPENQMSHIRIVTVEPTKIERVLRLPGTVAYNLFKTTPVITPVGGPVNRILATPGQMVRRGQPLLYVNSPDFAQLRASYLKAQNTFTLAGKNYQRAKDLYAHNAIAERDLLQAESDRAQAQADLQSAQQSLRILGLTDAQLAIDPLSPEIPVLAPISGEIVQRLIAPGQLVQAGATQCFTISDMSTVWVLVNVYQQDLPYIHSGDPVTIQTDAYPQPFHGRISYIAPELDPNTRTLNARIVTDNPGQRLKNNMYVTALVDAGVIPSALTVPEAAVLRDSENHPFVYVEAGNRQFARRLVDLGQSQQGLIQVTDGLRPGEKVAGDGSLFLQFANSLQR